jgi:hypothetical protein
VLTAIAEIVTSVGRTKLMCGELVKAVELTLFLALTKARKTVEEAARTLTAFL